LKTFLWAWKGQFLKVKKEVDRALRIILEWLEGVGCSPGFGPNCKPIFVGRSKRGKVWAPKRKPRPKAHYKPKTNSGLDSEVKPAGPVSLDGDFSMPIPSDVPS
jgi:hypothetical protein